MFRTNTLNHTHTKAPGLGYYVILILASLLAVVASATNSLGAQQDVQKLNRLVQASNSSDPAAKAFLVGREYVDGKKWAKAAEAFGNFVSEYPNDKNVDAALYWRAYAMVKQNKSREALESIEHLLASYPGSKWRDDAIALRLELTKDTSPAQDPTSESNEELKIIALQSLFQSNPANAIPIAAEWLKPGSKRSKEAKESALSLLAQYGGAQGAGIIAEMARNQTDEDLRETAIHWVAQRGSLADLIQLFDSEKSEDVKGTLLHWIAQKKEPEAMAKLMQVVKSDPSVEVRQSAIHWIAQRGGAQGTTFLIQLYDSERNQEIKETILHWIAQRQQDEAAMRKLQEVAKNDPSPEMRQTALHWVYQRSDAEALIQLYDTERNREVKESILHWISQRARASKSGQASGSQDAAMRKLMDVARNDSDAELRQTAIHWVSQTGGADGLNLLIQLYDAEKNKEVKESILHWIGQRKDQQATAKLSEIAKSDPDKELRSNAFHYLAQRGSNEGVDALIQFYDGERDEDVRENLLHWIGQAARNPQPGDSPQKRALRKLMQVAKSDQSVELRKQAVHWLGQSKDPEAAKFIEELIK